MGLTKKDMENILAEVKANIARLQGCDIPHDFKPTSGKPEATIGEKYECTKCKGRVDHVAYSWYVKGIEHASVLHVRGPGKE